jgi:hypothetical protein
MRRLAPILALGCLLATACGGTGNPRAVGLRDLPLPPGARVYAAAHTCDRGANAYCAEQAVIVGSYETSFDLLIAERRLLKRLKWTSSQGNTGKEIAAESPGHELRLTYATAYNDLLAIDESWIHRPPVIGHALSQTLFDRRPALSVMLERASS